MHARSNAQSECHLGADFTGHAFDLSGNKQKLHEGSITAMAISQDHALLYTASSDHSVRCTSPSVLLSPSQIKCWRRGSGAAWLVQCGEFICQSACLSLSVGAQYVVAGDSLGNVYVLSALL